MSKVSKKDLEVSQSKITNKGSLVPTATTKISIPNQKNIYDKAGNKCDVLPEDQIVAKHIVNNGAAHYLLRANQKNNLYNPFDSQYIDQSYAYGRQTGLAIYKYLDVDKSAFDNYLTFLRTKNASFLREAQRGF